MPTTNKIENCIRKKRGIEFNIRRTMHAQCTKSTVRYRFFKLTNKFINSISFVVLSFNKV